MTTDDFLQMIAMGYFPMAEHRKAVGYDFFAPKMRALLPLDLHIPRRLRRKVLQFPFTITTDIAFVEVINACAEARDTTWINDDIIALYTRLHHEGYVHSIECWQDDLLVGGLYGISIGGTFCGESMFARATDASKIALIHLCARLKYGGCKLLDSQFRNPHLDQFGLYEMPQDDYVALMQGYMAVDARFPKHMPDEYKFVEQMVRDKEK